MTAQAVGLGCTGPNDVACLCSNPNFGFGVRDCTAQSCPPGTDFAPVFDFTQQYCAGAAACKFCRT